MRHLIDNHRLKKLGMLAVCHLSLLLGSARAGTETATAPGVASIPPASAASKALAPAPAPAPAQAPAPSGKSLSRSYSVVAFNTNIKQSDFDGLSKATVLQMQNQLKSIYSKLADWQTDYTMKEQPLSDGIVGRITLSWLQRYGYTFRLETPPSYGTTLPDHVDRIASFGKAYPLELGALLSSAFVEWESRQSEKDQTRDAGVLRLAKTPDLLELYSRYNGGRAQAPRSAKVSADSGYSIYKLTAQDLNLLKDKEQLLPKLATLVQKPYHSQEEMRIGMVQALDNMQQLHKSLWPVVRAQARSYDGNLINEAALDKLEQELRLGKTDTLSQDAIDQLRDLGTIYLPSLAEYDKYINGKIADGTLKLTDDEVIKLAQATRVFDNFHLDEQGLENIKNQLKDNVMNAGMPEVVVRMLAQLQDVSYPEVSVFRSAAISKIDFGLAMCRLNSPTNNAYVAALRINDIDLDALEKQLEPLRQQSVDGEKHLQRDMADSFKRIRELRAIPGLCADSDDNESKELVRDLYLSYLGVAIEGRARKVLPAELPELKIKGSDCGCALDDMWRISYAFYPYWEESKGEQAINFRALNRIAFQTLTVDDFGNFQRGGESFDLNQKDSSLNSFVRTAHQYNSKVDWVIQKNDWEEGWKNSSPQSHRVVFKKIRDSIVALLTAPLTDTISKLKSYSTLGLEAKPRRGDGVTLYFPNYPSDPVATAEFNLFYRELRKLLDQNDLALNVLVSQNVFIAGRNGGPGAFGLSNLIKLRKERIEMEPNRPGGPQNDEFILVLLNEPSSDAKKLLRSSIESDSTMHGSDRADFVRSLLPVLHFDNRNWLQLEDDVVYARENFGGVGMWAPDFQNLAKPVEDTSLSCLQSMLVAVCLARINLSPGEHIQLPSWVEVMSCVHRWTLRVILALLLLTIVVVAFLYFRFCGARALIAKYFPYLLALVNIPALLVFTLLLLYDPLLARLATGNLPFIIAAVVCIATLFGCYKIVRESRRVPIRQHSKVVQHESGFPIVVWSAETNKDGFKWTIKNIGNSYAMIKKVVIMLDNHPFSNVDTALKSVLEPTTRVQWKGPPLMGTRVEPGADLLGLTITDLPVARLLRRKLTNKQIVVHITYCGSGAEHWVTDGKEIKWLHTL